MTNNFTHLHVHTEYSLLDGSAKITELIANAKALNMHSMAITDHGVMFGVIDFYKEAKSAGIKPIIGCEVYVAPGSRFDKENSYYHLVLLAENNTGYHNLIRLVSLGFTEGFYYKPRIDLELLKKYRDGLIALSGCLGGVVTRDILNVSYEKGLQAALTYRDIMGEGNFFLELQEHDIEEQQTANQQLIRLSKQTGIPLVCTNDVHYIAAEDSFPHEVLLCIQTGKTIKDEDRMRYHGEDYYLRTPQEMAQLFAHVPEALENVAKIAERCNVDIAFNQYKLPKFELPAGTNAFDYLSKLSHSGIVERYDNVTDELTQRLNYELQTIQDMGFADYFLVVADFVSYARKKGIVVGPGRGSAAGSLAAYCLGITNIDPIRFNLLFERFLNPERISMPDIDIDFCYERRQEVIDYVIQKYGASHVAQIITFGTMAAKAAVRDVGRGLGMPYASVDRIAKMVPTELGITIKRALQINPELQTAYNSEEDTRRLLDMSLRLEGLPRHASTHAAGVVICDEPVTEHVPLNLNDGVVTTQFSMNVLEELGLLKMDFLGLRTLTVINNAVDEIKRGRGINIDIDNIPFDDPKVFGLIAQAKTEGVFQLESSGMKSFMKELQPESLEDIIAGISLYRPGPMDFIPKYIAGKRDRQNIRYTHPSLAPILESTYGCIVYQEQVMQIVRVLAGYSLGRSDLIRRAMSKKKADVMAEERKNFIYGIENDVAGCIRNGIPKEAAEKIFDDMTDFAKYAFNKSHAAAYAVIGYQTAWLKVHYPVEFMAALLTSVMDFTSKVAEYIHECKEMSISLLPPDVNESFTAFSVSNGTIRFGLLAIKNVGRGIINNVVREREAGGKFTSLTQFINRMDGKDLNKRCLESLIKAGAFDSLGGNRAQYMQAYADILNGIGHSKKKNVEGQLNLFELTEDISQDRDILPEVAEYSTKMLLALEKEVLGIYVSGHPLSSYQHFLGNFASTSSLDFKANAADDQQVVFGGIIVHNSIKYTKSNKPMSFLTVEDLYGAVEVVVFPQTYEKYWGRLEPDNVIIIKGRASLKEEEDAKIICNEIILHDDAPRQELWLKFSKDKRISMEELQEIATHFKGEQKIVVYDADKKGIIKMPPLHINITPESIAHFRGILGEKAVAEKGRE